MVLIFFNERAEISTMFFSKEKDLQTGAFPYVFNFDQVQVCISNSITVIRVRKEKKGTRVNWNYIN